MLEREREDRYLWRGSLGFLFLSLFPSSRRWTKGNRKEGGDRPADFYLPIGLFARRYAIRTVVIVTCWSRATRVTLMIAFGPVSVVDTWMEFGPARLVFPVQAPSSGWPQIGHVDFVPLELLWQVWILFPLWNTVTRMSEWPHDRMRWLVFGFFRALLLFIFNVYGWDLRRTSLKDCLTMVLNFCVLSVSSFQLPRSQSAYVNMYNLLPFMDSIIVCA